MRPADLNTPWAALLLDRLAASGVRHAVLSPGSRSTPLTLAAARTPGLAVHTLIDERTAAFFALGLARAGGQPVLLIATSGSAGAHWHPALVEADAAGLPLVALTADRPPELHHRAAAQTTDQVRLFGTHVRRYFELGAPDESPAALEGLAATAALAVATARAPSAGPVHLNAWFRPPLEPQSGHEADAAYRATVETLRARPPVRRYPPRRLPARDAIAALAARCRAVPRGAIVCGPGPLGQSALRPAVARLAALTGYPVWAEAGSQLRFRGRAPRAGFVDFFDPLLRAAGAPDLVLQLGAPPVSKAFDQSAASATAPERWVLTAHGWNDPWNRAAGIVAAALDETLGALCDALEDGPRASDAWSGAWQEADTALAASIADAWDGSWTEPCAVRETVRSLGATPEESPAPLLALSNSLPVREVDLFVPGDAAVCGVLVQRGVNGIDGLLASAAGSAAATGRPVTLLCGDVAFAHDAGGLAAVRLAGAPVRTVVLDNGGGRIFELLPIAGDQTLAPLLEEHFFTPPALEVAAAARAFGVPAIDAVEADGPGGLQAALAGDGSRVVRIALPHGGARDHRARLDALAADAVRRARLRAGQP